MQFPGLYAAPGAAWPGAAWPGEPGPERMPVTIGYHGDDTRIYPGYRDQGTGRTLVASPGGYYTIMAVEVSLAASEGTPAVPGDGRWTPGATWS